MREDATFTALRWQEAIAAGSIDWTSFTEWLEADPANREAYRAVSCLDAMIGSHGIAAQPGKQAAMRAKASHTDEPGTLHEPRRRAGATIRYSAAKPM